MKNNIIINTELNCAEMIISSKVHGEKRVLIDIEDIERVQEYKWCYSNYSKIKEGYISHTINKSLNIPKTATLKLHRFVMNCSKDMVIDHINRDTLDNRKRNLRICTQTDNHRNRSISKTNISGIRGVYWDKEKNKYRALITVNSKKIHIGYYNTIEEAKQARIEAEYKYWGESYKDKD